MLLNLHYRKINLAVYGNGLKACEREGGAGHLGESPSNKCEGAGGRDQGRANANSKKEHFYMLQ